ncbi:MAG: 3'(2'),5'-bisphosphate nucleotidase CysQ, partial [Spirochaetaceae bacterium]|nr:3'(2'),5'-bisphosphate nucleotidase CysQ [Spirochaetaceae bacterium]
VISEEDNNEIPYEDRKDWDMFWLVDPLDGTKEFIKREQDFTVNIALVEKGIPIWGVVLAPARNWLYCGGTLEQTCKVEPGKSPVLLPFSGSLNRETVVAVRSKSHAKPEEDVVLKKYGVTDTVSMGSSLKFCLVAEGTADLYFRAGPTWEWDTAAAHAVVLGADCDVTDDNKPLVYNKPSLKNDNGFLCVRNKLK